MKSASLLASMTCLLITCTLVKADEPPPSAEASKEWIRVITPQENSEVVEKKPLLKVEFLETLQIPTLLVILDGTDITQLLTVTERGFEYRPVAVLPSGAHTLSISAKDPAGNPFEKNISFTSRHTRAFREIFSNNEPSLIYEYMIYDYNAPSSTPRSKVEGNLKSDSQVKKENWQFSFNTNLRYLDQSMPVISPLKKGVEPANWLLTGIYAKDSLQSRISLGDIQVNETPYTASNLGRRGGAFNFEYDRYQLNFFSVKSEQVFGFEGGAGLGGRVEDSIHGISGGIKFFDNKIEGKAIYVTGGELGSSLGVSTLAGAKEGDVLGFFLTSDFFQGKMKTELEADFSRYDPDTSDEFGKNSDLAYRAKVGGQLKVYSYEAMYEYIGRDYQVVGNQGLLKDRQGVSLRNGLTLATQSLQLLLSRYNDNVRGDGLFPQIVNHQGTLDYSFSKFPKVPMGLSYQKSLQESTQEPPNTLPTRLSTDTVTGTIGYNLERWMLNFQTTYSLMDDQTAANNDSSSITFTFSPSYNIPRISIIPSFSFNQSKSHLTDVRTDTYTGTLDFRSKFFRERASFDVGSTYNVIRASDDSANSQTLNANIRLGYQIKNYFTDFLNPTIAIRGTFNKVMDKVNPSLEVEEYTLFLVLTVAPLFSF